MAFNKLVYIQLHLYDRWQINTIQYNPLVSWSFTLTVSKEMNMLSRLPRLFIRNWAEACCSCDWFYPADNSSFSGRVQVAAVSSPTGWIRVAADFLLMLAPVPAAGCKLWLTPSQGWLEFWQLDTSYSWLHPTDDLSSGGWIRVTDDYILWLTLLPIAGYNLRLIPSCGWLWVAADSSFGCLIRVTADSILRLTTSCGWFYQVNLRIYSAKYIILMVCFLRPDFS